MSGDPPDEKEEKVRALDEDDIALLKTYGQGPYSVRIKDVEKDVKEIVKKVNDVSGIKESDTGLAPPSRWDLVSDKQAMQEEQPLQVRIERHACAVAGSFSWTVSSELSSEALVAWEMRLVPTSRQLNQRFYHGIFAGCTVHKDHQAWHRGGQVCDQRKANSQGVQQFLVEVI